MSYPLLDSAIVVGTIVVIGGIFLYALGSCIAALIDLEGEEKDE